MPILSASFREADVTQVHTHSLMDSAGHGPARELCRRYHGYAYYLVWLDFCGYTV